METVANSSKVNLYFQSVFQNRPKKLDDTVDVLLGQNLGADKPFLFLFSLTHTLLSAKGTAYDGVKRLSQETGYIFKFSELQNITVPVVTQNLFCVS